MQQQFPGMPFPPQQQSPWGLEYTVTSQIMSLETALAIGREAIGLSSVGSARNQEEAVEGNDSVQETNQVPAEWKLPANETNIPESTTKETVVDKSTTWHESPVDRMPQRNVTDAQQKDLMQSETIAASQSSESQFRPFREEEYNESFAMTPKRTNSSVEQELYSSAAGDIPVGRLSSGKKRKLRTQMPPLPLDLPITAVESPIQPTRKRRGKRDKAKK
jgi:hypothetical protein